MRPLGSSSVLEKRRRKAIQFLEKGLKPVEVARAVGVDRRSVRRWKSAYLHYGIKALEAKPSPGRPSRLTPAFKRELAKMVHQAPKAYGFKAERWTYALIVRGIRKKFGVSYHRNYIGPLMRSIGWPTHRAPVKVNLRSLNGATKKTRNASHPMAS